LSLGTAAQEKIIMAGSKTSDSSQRDSIFAEIKSFFTSVKTTIALLFLLAATSIIGTVIPQGTPEQQNSAGPSFYYRLAVILDLHNVYRSWWFILLLIFLSLNLVGCLLRRLSALPAEWKGTSRKTSFSFTVSDSRLPKDIKGIVISAMKGLLGVPLRVANEKNTLNLEWLKHRIYLLGFPFIHLAIIVILLGGLIGLLRSERPHPDKRRRDRTRVQRVPSGAKHALPSKAVDSHADVIRPAAQRIPKRCSAAGKRRRS
jgi:cytochrome c biogenesis protein